MSLSRPSGRGGTVMKSFTFLEEFVNLPELLDRVENDEDLLAELLALFQEDLPESRAALQTAIDRGNLRDIERAAHRLKGMLANLSARDTASLAAEIESTARAGNAQKIPELVSMFDLLITAFSTALDSFMAST
jgi:HPt (histidine-containing phosphotransfer) domain-containing protein